MTVDVDRLKALAEPVLRRLGYELWDLDFVRGPQGYLLRVMIDGIAGVTLEDCTRASRELSPALDVEDLINTPYSLEISSPGLERVLRTEEHFRCAIGQYIRLRTREPITGRRHFAGRLVAVRDGGIVVEVEGAEQTLALASVKQAQTIHDWALELKRKKGA